MLVNWTISPLCDLYVVNTVLMGLCVEFHFDYTHISPITRFMVSPVLKETPEGIIVPIKVIPKASNTQVVGWENGELKIRLMAVPEKGKANKILIRFIANLLCLSQSHVTLIFGETGPHKRICISGITLDRLKEYLKLED